MFGRGTPWRVSHKAERQSVILNDPSDLVEIMRWLGDTAELAFKSRLGSPASFAIGIPAQSHTVAHFFNWKVKFGDGELVFIETTGDPVRDEDTDKKARDSFGEVVYEELWERRFEVEVTLYNHGDAHFEGAREFVQAREDQKFVFLFKTYDVSTVTPMGPNFDQGATEEDVESVLPPGLGMMPDIKFEQQDASGAFLPLGSAKFETWSSHPHDPPRQVITAEHRYGAFKAMLKNKMPPEIARDQVDLAFKDAYMFDEHDADVGGEQGLETVSSDLYIRVEPEEFEVRSYAGTDFTGFSVIYRLPPTTRRRGRTSPSSPRPGEGKREKTEAPYFMQAKCSFCNRRKATAVCDGCGEAEYCGAQCQKIAWHFDEHHKTCRS